MVIASIVANALGAAAVIATLAVGGWMVWARWQDKRESKHAAIKSVKAGEEKAAEELVHWLSGRRVLWNPKTKEVPGETLRSVLAMRERVEASYGGLTKPEARAALETIRQACIGLLDEPRKESNGFFSEDAWRSLKRLRRKVRPAISKVAEIYGIEAPVWGDYRGGFEDKGVAVYIPPPER